MEDLKDILLFFFCLNESSVMKEMARSVGCRELFQGLLSLAANEKTKHKNKRNHKILFAFVFWLQVPLHHIFTDTRPDSLRFLSRHPSVLLSRARVRET
jgi:hypothetical protein